MKEESDDDAAKEAVFHQKYAGQGEDGALASELDAAKRVYTAIASLEPSAADRVCQWALARRVAEDCRLAGAHGLIGASLTQKSYRGT